MFIVINTNFFKFSFIGIVTGCLKEIDTDTILHTHCSCYLFS